jgi:hypothetical protein
MADKTGPCSRAGNGPYSIKTDSSCFLLDQLGDGGRPQPMCASCAGAADERGLAQLRGLTEEGAAALGLRTVPTARKETALLGQLGSCGGPQPIGASCAGAAEERGRAGRPWLTKRGVARTPARLRPELSCSRGSTFGACRPRPTRPAVGGRAREEGEDWGGFGERAEGEVGAGAGVAGGVELAVGGAAAAAAGEGAVGLGEWEVAASMGAGEVEGAEAGAEVGVGEEAGEEAGAGAAATPSHPVFPSRLWSPSRPEPPRRPLAPAHSLPPPQRLQPP